MTVSKGNELSFFSYGPEQTRRFGQHLAMLLQPGDLILLSGRLGVGKTHFAQGIAQGLGVEEPVRSPTFTLINEYDQARIPLYHMDLYRLEGERDLATVGLDDYFDADGVVVVEWPERGEGWLPGEALHIRLRHIDDYHRVIDMDPHGARATDLLAAFKHHTFAGM